MAKRPISFYILLLILILFAIFIYTFPVPTIARLSLWALIIYAVFYMKKHKKTNQKLLRKYRKTEILMSASSLILSLFIFVASFITGTYNQIILISAAFLFFFSILILINPRFFQNMNATAAEIGWPLSFNRAGERIIAILLAVLFVILIICFTLIIVYS
jgi:hypothetical protein